MYISKIKLDNKMNKTKEIWITGFALFSLFFGAGNLILPPSLGVKSGLDWWVVVIGFVLTAVTIPILAIFAHAKLQGTLYDLGKKVSPIFSTIFCYLTYLIAIAIPAPRTASVVHEMTIQPFVNSSSIITSSIYFLLVFIFAINRSKIISLIGKFLTPIIVLILLIIISIIVMNSSGITTQSSFQNPLVDGILEGYQTFDAIGGVVVGAVIIISLNLRGHTTFESKKEIITKAGVIAGLGLLIIYGGLIFSGAILSSSFTEETSRIGILTGLSKQALGNFGTTFLSVLVSIACFTTAVGIVTGTADYIKGVFNNSQKAYFITAIIGCLIGIIVGSYNVDFIIDFAVPSLMFLYPITIVLIILNVIPEKYTSEFIFRAVILVTFLFSIPDFLAFIISKEKLEGIVNFIPLAKFNLGWVIPSFLTFLVLNTKNLRLNR